MKNSALLRIAPLILAALPLRAATDRVAEASSGQAPDKGDLVLFPLDDVSIPWRDNLKLTLERPTKHPGNPVLKAGPDDGPDGFGTILYGTVLKQNGRFRMWYIAAPRPDSRIPGDIDRIAHYRPVAYAESSDGIHWRRPSLGLVDFRGNRNNNLVQIEPASNPYSIPHDFAAVFFDRDEPVPARRYTMAYIVDDRVRGTASTATAVSPDGLHWSLVNDSWRLTKGQFENTSLIRYKGLYYLGGQNFFPFGGELPDGSAAGRLMKVLFSPDFERWSGERALAFYRSDYKPVIRSYGREVHMGAGLWVRGNVILGFYGRWNGEGITVPPNSQTLMRTKIGSLMGLQIDLGLVISNDAIHYREPVRNFIEVPHGAEGDWDYGAVQQANAFANTDTRTYIWYSRGSLINPGPTPPLPGPLPPGYDPEMIGLLTLPRDRFGSFTKLLAVSQERNPAFDAPREASCLSRSLRLSQPSRLSVNVARVSPGASLEIALVDDAERPLSGCTARLDKPGLKIPIIWSKGDPELPVNQPFRVRVRWPAEVNEPKLYAIYIEHD